MTKFQKKILPTIILISFVLLIIGFIHSAIFNDYRFIKPLDLDLYEFNAKDLFVLIPAVFFFPLAIFSCIFYGIVVFKYFIVNSENNISSGKYTTTINKKLGLLGLLGLLGFTGFIPFHEILGLPLAFDTSFLFGFFSLFGLFSFYFQGKYSNILIDERFLYNKMKADSLTYKSALFFIFVVTLLILSRFSFDITVTLLIITISLAVAMTFILKSYLLYHFDSEE